MGICHIMPYQLASRISSINSMKTPKKDTEKMDVYTPAYISKVTPSNHQAPKCVAVVFLVYGVYSSVGWGSLVVMMWFSFNVSNEKKKKRLTFHYTGCLIRLNYSNLTMVYSNPHIIPSIP